MPEESKPKPTLTKEGAFSAILAAGLLLTCGTLAILAESWKPAAVGLLAIFAVLIVGAVYDRLKP